MRQLAAAVGAEPGGHVGVGAVDLRRSPTSGCSGWRRPAVASTRRAPGRAPIAGPAWSARPSRRLAPVGMSMRSVFDRSCTNQSCTMNWIHEAAIRFRIVAGWNWSRVISSRLTTRGLGISRFGGVREGVLERDVAPETATRQLPSSGTCRSLYVPSVRPRLAQRRIEIRRQRPASRAAAPRCRAGSSPAARCGSRRASAWPAAAAACTRGGSLNSSPRRSVEQIGHDPSRRDGCGRQAKAGGSNTLMISASIASRDG